MSSLKTLVFLDIDGTLLRPDYTTNSSGVPRIIKRLSAKGYVFSLNSNRALADLLPLARKFGIKGPLIAENGVFMSLGSKKTFFVKAPKIHQVLGPALAALANKKGARVSYIDTVRYGKEKRSAIRESWLVNKYREYTASIHVRTYGMRDERAADMLAQELRGVLPKSYVVSVSPMFANVLVSPKSADKGKAISAMRKRLFRSTPVIMVGDDAADLPALDVVDAFYAVGNAERSIQKRARFVAKRSYTQGVEEILRHIEKYSATR